MFPALIADPARGGDNEVARAVSGFVDGQGALQDWQGVARQAVDA